jgi:hypothetical protein
MSVSPCHKGGLLFALSRACSDCLLIARGQVVPGGCFRAAVKLRPDDSSSPALRCTTAPEASDVLWENVAGAYTPPLFSST